LPGDFVSKHEIVSLPILGSVVKVQDFDSISVDAVDDDVGKAALEAVRACRSRVHCDRGSASHFRDRIEA
jgi:hypothetical protein